MKNNPPILPNPVCSSVAGSLSVLQQLQSDGNRTGMPLLRAHNTPSLEWNMFVPEVFNDAIGIKRMERRDAKTGQKHTFWRQSNMFAFAAGDVLHERNELHQDFKESRTLFQVKQATPAVGTRGGSSGSVAFDIFEKKEPQEMWKKLRSMTVTQGEFVRILIAGFSSELHTHQI
jgi:hypothetical protein